jgi:hypothetical protein
MIVKRIPREVANIDNQQKYFFVEQFLKTSKVGLLSVGSCNSKLLSLLFGSISIDY